MSSKSRLIFVDSGILIAAARGDSEMAERALRVLDDRQARFASSDLVRLEVLPKAAFNRRTSEVAFYRTFFHSVVVWASISQETVRLAIQEAERAGLGPMDALHLVAASQVGADVFVTTERETRPIHRTQLVQVETIHPVE